ncbi:hypothetical protein V5O48_007153 [Marasmius crinis-equi]|uniref:F-box domain-containing protein n=1 Tax=Marasmius crinis-equi TaxID=585013 RepID=A0ABR3FHI3_9AGAR
MTTNTRDPSSLSTWLSIPAVSSAPHPKTKRLCLPFRKTVTEFDRRIIRKSLIDAEKEAQNLQRELNRLRAVIIAVESRTTGVQGEIEHYRALLSPVQRMPPEIMTEIFTRCAQKSDLSREMPGIISASRVCGRWRELALSTPSVWSSITISIERKAMNDDDDSDSFHIRRNTKIFLERSKTSRLAVDLSWLPSRFDEKEVAYVCNALRRNASRIHELNLKLTAAVSQHPSLQVLRTSFPALRRLRFVVCRTVLAGNVNITDMDLFSGAPALRAVELGSQGTFALNKLNLPWQQLESLELSNWPRVAESLSSLSMCSNLRRVALTGLDLFQRLGEPEYSGGPVVLPSLQYLSLSSENEGRISQVLEHITLPNLQSVEIKCDDPHFWQEWALASFRDLLARSRCTITSLELRSTRISDHHAISLLHSLHDLLSLRIEEEGDELDDYHDSLQEQHNRTVTSTFLRALSLRREETSNLCTPSILPMLTDLDLLVHPTGLDVTALVHAVGSRWASNVTSNPNVTPKDASRLRSVKIDLFMTGEDCSSTIAALSALECFRDAGLSVMLPL